MIEIKSHIGNYRSLSQILSPTIFREVVIKSDYSNLNYRIEKHLDGFASYDYNSIIYFLYKKLEENYRNEYLYKNALLNKKLLNEHCLNSTTVLNEFKIGSSIADFVLLNGEVKIFEIKTDLDGFEKLEKQVNDYKKFANRIYIVLIINNLQKIMCLYENSNIGIIVFKEDNTLETIKEANQDTSEFEHLSIFKTLRVKEYLEIIFDELGFIPNVPNTRIFKESFELIKKINIAKFQSLAFNKLKQRKLKCPEILESELIPSELKHLCYTLDFSQKEYDNLFKFLKTTM